MTSWRPSKGCLATFCNEVLQSEIDEQLAYDKHQRTEPTEADSSKNYRNGTIKRKMKTQLGEIEISVLRTTKANMSPK